MLQHSLEYTQKYTRYAKFFKVESKTNGDHYSKRHRIFLKKNIKVRQAKSCDLFLQSQVNTHAPEWSSITKRLFMKMVSQEQLYLICGKTNTALGYSKGSECSQKVLKILLSIHAILKYVTIHTQVSTFHTWETLRAKIASFFTVF